jgi:peptidoglycan/LPS O-acetylase OafA/YrhL
MAEHSGLQFLPLFVLGIALAKFQVEIVSALRILSWKSSAALLFLSLVLIEARIYVPWEYPDLRPEYISGLGAGLLIMLALARPQLSRALVNPVTRLLGSASYSLYLLHVPILLAVVPPIYSHTSSVLISVAGGFGVSILVAQCVYQFVEFPCQIAGRKLARKLSNWANVR